MEHRCYGIVNDTHCLRCGGGVYYLRIFNSIPKISRQYLVSGGFETANWSAIFGADMASTTYVQTYYPALLTTGAWTFQEALREHQARNWDPDRSPRGWTLSARAYARRQPARLSGSLCIPRAASLNPAND